MQKRRETTKRVEEGKSKEKSKTCFAPLLSFKEKSGRKKGVIAKTSIPVTDLEEVSRFLKKGEVSGIRMRSTDSLRQQ